MVRANNGPKYDFMDEWRDYNETWQLQHLNCIDENFHKSGPDRLNSYISVWNLQPSFSNSTDSVDTTMKQWLATSANMTVITELKLLKLLVPVNVLYLDL